MVEAVAMQSKEVSAVIEEVSARSQSMVQFVDTITSSEMLSNMASELQETVQKFRF
ncbi:hypothetical protein [Domibacillus tundrae]|uniref:hypothetical protein n=1 Tax=Domibacillus tundrae TaxID=1587527 RepID=UPI0012E07652|nr:hypothetical protein [Domibacillus tundrae]